MSGRFSPFTPCRSHALHGAKCEVLGEAGRHASILGSNLQTQELQTLATNIDAGALWQWAEVEAQYSFLHALVLRCDFHNPRMPQSVDSGASNF